MVQVHFVGFSSDEESELREALDFFCKILFHGNMLNHMTFYVQKNVDLEVQGECWPEDQFNRTFVIDLRCAAEDDLPSDTLAHELVHCRQWARNQLSATSEVIARQKSDGVIELATNVVEAWEGKIWKPRPGEHPYFDSPWEIEAYGKALGMVARWNDYKEKKREKIKDEICNQCAYRDLHGTGALECDECSYFGA